MSTLPDPYPERSRAGKTLSSQEQAVLSQIAGHENAADPGFVTRLGSARTARTGEEAAATPEDEAREVAVRARRRDLAIQVAVIVALAAFLLPAAFFVAGVITIVLLVVPMILVTQAWREAQRASGGTGEGTEGSTGDSAGQR